MEFDLILADCPTPYGMYRDNATGINTAKIHYPLMTWADLGALGPDIRAVCAQITALFLWTTPPQLLQTLPMAVNDWGFEFKTKGFAWLKTNPKAGTPFFGQGKHTRANTEDCYLLMRGPKVLARVVNNISQIVSDLPWGMAQQTIVDALEAFLEHPDGITVEQPITRHSAKPEEVQDKLEQLYGPVRRLELFARRKRAGWTCIGNELGGWDIRESLAILANDYALDPSGPPPAGMASLLWVIIRRPDGSYERWSRVAQAVLDKGLNEATMRDRISRFNVRWEDCIVVDEGVEAGLRINTLLLRPLKKLPL